jgi:hypothetical protein
MKTTTTLVSALLAALVLVAPTALADEPADRDEGRAQCPPLWIDSHGNPHLDPTCIGPRIGPLFDNSP